METKQIIGEIQNIRNDKKAIQISNEWFNFFKPDLELIKGDTVKVNYVIKKTNDKSFNNIKSYEIVEEALVTNVGNLDNKAIPLSDSLTPTDKNCILMVAKDLYLDNKEYTLEEYIERVKYNRLKL